MNLQITLDATKNRSLKTYAKRLEKLEITTLHDILYHIPFRYEDYSLFSTISQVQPGEVVTLKGHIVEAKNDYTRRFKTLQKVLLTDGTGSIELTWFNQPYLVKSLKPHDMLSVSGRVETFGSKVTMISPNFEVLYDQASPTIHTGRLVPIYPETAGVSSKWLRRQIFQLLTQAQETLEDFIPRPILDRYKYDDLITTLWHIHFPHSYDEVVSARKRLSFEELFLLQLAAMSRKKAWRERLKGQALNPDTNKKQITSFIQSLPFELTSSQKQAIETILDDLGQEKPMNRLLQGDVGSGKTIVAATVMYHTFLHGFQSVLMAPTAILAEQHYQSLTSFLKPLGVRVGLATGSKKHNTRADAFDILIGTHALITQTQTFSKLALVVIDEQQRFGVEQRGILKAKGGNPHLLTMTATPIPRTAALAVYGDLDVSYLMEMPKGRKPIKTWLVPPEKRDGAYAWIQKEIENNDSQAFIICPFIEESENMQTVKAASKEFERLKKEVYPDLKLGLLHGKLKAKEKDTVLGDFRQRKFDLLVATPVVEVGIDIPNATIIMIEAAERFGLAGLHQLRGRVGRGDKQSYCLLFTEGKSEQTIQRLKAMETMHQGAELAEYDLQLRGPGEVYGTRQSGSSFLKIASFSDVQLIDQAKKEAAQIFPTIDKYPALVQKIATFTTTTVNPD